MIPRLGVIGGLLLMLVPHWTMGQDRAPIPFVDVGTAQALVDTLSKENETLKADSLRLRKESSQLTELITSSRKWIEELQPLLDEVKARNSDIATASEPLVDRSLKVKAAAAAEKSKAAEKKLVKRIEDLQGKAAEMAKQIEGKLYQAAVNDAKIGRNNDDIIILQATITRTKLQEAQLQSLVSQIDLLSTKVDSFIQQSQAVTPVAK